MIYFISDPHGGNCTAGFERYFEICTEDDLLIVLGDLGLMFEDTEKCRQFTRDFEGYKQQIAFLDGNHENFDYLYAFPEEDWNGGRIHRISENIVHLQRGNIYHIDGKSFFVMGGSKSSAKWKEAGLWYPQEDPTKEEIALAYENLKKHNNTVDYVLSHKYWKDGSKSDDRYSLLGLQGFIDENVTFQRWYAGHWHCNHVFDEKHLFVYDEPTPLK